MGIRGTTEGSGRAPGACRCRRCAFGAFAAGLLILLAAGAADWAWGRMAQPYLPHDEETLALAALDPTLGPGRLLGRPVRVLAVPALDPPVREIDRRRLGGRAALDPAGPNSPERVLLWDRAQAYPVQTRTLWGIALMGFSVCMMVAFALGCASWWLRRRGTNADAESAAPEPKA